MKQFFFFKNIFLGASLFLVSSIFNVSVAQSDSIPDWSEHKPAKNQHSYRTRISLLAFGVGVMSPANHSGTLNVSIPYETMDANGLKKSHTFYGTKDDMFSNPSPQLIFGFDISRPHYVFNFTSGFNVTYKGALYSIGNGFNLYLGNGGSNLYEKTKKCTWVLRPSLDITYFSFSSGSIGSITNTNTTIYILDREVGPTYTHSVFPSKNFPSNYYHRPTAHADNLVISYKQKQIGFQPKIALCTNPYKAKYSVQIFASYFIPVYESSGLILRQYSNSRGERHLVSGSSTNNLRDKNEIQASYNNRSFTSAAFHANYFYVGIAFGFTFQN